MTVSRLESEAFTGLCLMVKVLFGNNGIFPTDVFSTIIEF